MKKGKVFFHPIDGSGALTISWTSGPKGDAVEAKKGSGVGFFSHSGELLCVIFDEVRADRDHQSLEFTQYRVEILIKNGKVTHSVNETNSKLRPTKIRTGNKQHFRSKPRAIKTHC
jgi:hypothetical protein